MVKPVTKREIYDLTVKYCDRILEILKDWEGSNDHPPGRIIYQCEWLKQEIEYNRLPVPFFDRINNIRHTYTDGDMPDEAYEKGIERYLQFIISLSKGYPVIEPRDYPEVQGDIDRLLQRLRDGGWESKEGVPELLEDLAAIRERLETTEEVIPLPFAGHKFFDNPDWFGWYDPFFEGHPELDEMLYEVATEIFTGRFEKRHYTDPAPPQATLEA